jgi:hypothetical protein
MEELIDRYPVSNGTPLDEIFCTIDYGYNRDLGKNYVSPFAHLRLDGFTLFLEDLR